MKKIDETNNVTYFANDNTTRLANIVRNSNNKRHFKVITKDEQDNIKILATRCNYSTALKIVKEFLQ